MNEYGIASVSQVNDYIKQIIDREEALNFLCVRGEISNYKKYPSGHHYFTLKDPDSSLRCVMFKGNAFRLRFRPENGMKVLAFGKVSVFSRDGGYQLYCEQLTAEGAGDLHAAFEQLKSRLREEGLFDPAHKKVLPVYPKRIAIVTSSAGAAVHDMLRIIARRYPIASACVVPVRVQGIEAPAEICDAIEFINEYKLADVIITGRGGGSMEDLWAFNDERLARTIYRSDIPVISAVGHEPDVTISDYVADLRAATPSNAAELVVPDRVELVGKLEMLQERMFQIVHRQIKQSRQRIEMLRSSKCMKSPLFPIHERRKLLEYRQKELLSCTRSILETNRKNFGQLAAALDAMSPLKVLARGYSVTQCQGEILTDASKTCEGQQITIKLHRGELAAVVTDIRRGEDEQ